MQKFAISTHETDPATPFTVDKVKSATTRDAIEDAEIALGDAARQSLRGRSHAGFHTEIRDGSGRILFRASLTFASPSADTENEAPSRPEKESRSAP